MALTDGKHYFTSQVHYIVWPFTNATLSGTYDIGTIPAGAGVIASGVFINAAWNGTGNEELDLGFRAAEHTTDDDAFTETALDLDAAVGHIEGDVVSAANLWFTRPAIVTAKVTNTDATAGRAWAYVAYIVADVG